MELLTCIDPGHGGHDPGRIGRLGSWTLYESHVVWAVAVALGLALDPLPVVTTRKQSTFLTPGARARFANRHNAAIMVSLHCNGSTRPSAHGFEVWHYPNSREGSRLAKSVLEELEIATYRRNRGIKPQSREDIDRAKDLSVLSMTRMPAILVELEFLSNPDGHRHLADARHQANYARAIARGIRRYLAEEN